MPDLRAATSSDDRAQSLTAEQVRFLSVLAASGGRRHYQRIGRVSEGVRKGAGKAGLASLEMPYWAITPLGEALLKRDALDLFLFEAAVAADAYAELLGASPNIVRRFWDAVDRFGPNGCWLWRGGASEKRPSIQLGSRGAGRIIASRLSLILDNRAAPPNLEACHRCDMPSCVNPEHLFHGTHLENMQDSVAKGRNYKGGPDQARRGAKHPMALLSEQDVRDIRRQAAAGTRQIDIASQYKVTRTAISSIVQRRSWRHVDA